MRRACLLLVAPAFLLACSSSGSEGPAPAVDSGGPPLLSDAGACGVTTQRYSITSANHLPQGTPVPYVSNPPCGGDHYAQWITWGAHSIAIPPGNWVHNLEHGGVAFLYRCASRAACPDVAAKMEALAASLPIDPVCTADGEGVRTRVVVVPDPDLPVGVEVAAAAWGNTLVARCWDEAAFHDFFVQHEGHGSEDFCAQGFIEDGPDAGPADAASETGDAGDGDAGGIDASAGG